jgi:hypothetical protein
MINFILSIVTRFRNKQLKDSREVFYFNKIYFKRITTICNLYKHKKKNNAVDTTLESIQPLNLVFSTPYKDVLNVIGTPKFIYNNKNKHHNHKAAILRHSISNINFTLQCQFYNNQLFFLAFDMSKKVKTEIERIEITNTIVEKYLKKTFNQGDEFPVIEDGEGNFIIINDDINFSICYCRRDVEEVFRNIEKLSGNIKPQLTKKEKEGLSYTF